MAAALVLEALTSAPPFEYLACVEPPRKAIKLEAPPRNRTRLAAPPPLAMAQELAPESSIIMIHTGNVRRCNHQLASKPSTQDEIVTALKCTMHCWRDQSDDDFVLAKEFIGHPKLMDRIEPAERVDKQITAKLFVTQPYTAGMVDDALSAVKKTLAVDNVDNFIVKLTNSPDEDILSNDFVTMWEELLNHGDAVSARGVADFTQGQLAAIEVAGLPHPDINQLHASQCRSMPSELRKHAKAHHMKLLSHQDDGDPLSSSDFQHVMNKVLEGKEAFTPATATPANSPPTSPEGVRRTLSVSWSPLWVLRYVVVDSTRSVVDNIGYIICGKFAAE